MEFTVWIIIIYILISPFYFTFVNIIGLIYAFKNKSFMRKLLKINDFLTMLFGVIFTLILVAFMGYKDFYIPLLIPTDTSNLHSPIASWHLPTVLALAIIGLLGYTILRLARTSLPPMQTIILFSFMFIGILICSLFIIQLWKNITTWEALYLSLLPLNFIICSISLMKSILTEYTFKISDNQINYKMKLLTTVHIILLKSRNWPVLALTLTLPILIVLMCVLVIFGQQPDALIKAFTETSDWLLSKQISPPPIQVDGHYLCTVSLRGHHKIVKPIRHGMRREEKIVVNRQLLIANAFEQVIEEKVPKIHKFIRHLYDKYGYPLSKHIISPWSADIVYILMKPLEWFFLLVIYLVDITPEDRIARQYLPKSFHE